MRFQKVTTKEGREVLVNLEKVVSVAEVENQDFPEIKSCIEVEGGRLIACRETYHQLKEAVFGQRLYRVK